MNSESNASSTITTPELDALGETTAALTAGTSGQQLGGSLVADLVAATEIAIVVRLLRQALDAERSGQSALAAALERESDGWATAAAARLEPSRLGVVVAEHLRRER